MRPKILIIPSHLEHIFLQSMVSPVEPPIISTLEIVKPYADEKVAEQYFPEKKPSCRCKKWQCCMACKSIKHPKPHR